VFHESIGSPDSIYGPPALCCLAICAVTPHQGPRITPAAALRPDTGARPPPSDGGRAPHFRTCKLEIPRFRIPIPAPSAKCKLASLANSQIEIPNSISNSASFPGPGPNAKGPQAPKAKGHRRLQDSESPKVEITRPLLYCHITESIRNTSARSAYGCGPTRRGAHPHEHSST